MKKISIILFTCLFICNNSYADHKGWPHGKKWAYNCAKTTDCNIVIENILEQPKLFIGKSVINGGNKVKNIAEKGDPIKPIKMVGIWKENWKGSKIFVRVRVFFPFIPLVRLDRFRGFVAGRPQLLVAP